MLNNDWNEVLKNLIPFFSAPSMGAILSRKSRPTLHLGEFEKSFNINYNKNYDVYKHGYAFKSIGFLVLSFFVGVWIT